VKCFAASGLKRLSEMLCDKQNFQKVFTGIVTLTRAIINFIKLKGYVMKSLKKFAVLSLACAGLFMGASALFAEPEVLNQSEIRQEIMQREDKVVEFLKNASKDLNEKMQAGIADGSVNPQDMDSIKKAMNKYGNKLFAEAEALRKTLKEPEERLKLDMEMLGLVGQAAPVNQAVKIINNWAGDIREIMIITTAQKLQMIKEATTPEFDKLIEELKNSKNPKIVEAAERMLNEFFRNPVGKEFPQFPKGVKTTDGKDLTLERFKGKVLLVDFWATWCPPCRAEVPNLVKAYEEYNKKGFEIIGISFDESREKFDEYIKENKMPWPQYFDGKGWQNEVGPTYGIQSIPTMYLLDKDGKVITTDLRGGKLEEALAENLK
jgi:thiol-disulfide isomerase/thioredoxin